MIGTLASWRSYSSARGDTAPTDADDTLAQQALTRASDYITANYVNRFSPPHDETADGVEQATYIAAGLELGKPGFFTATYTPAQSKVLTKVDSIEWEAVGGQTGHEGHAPTSTAIAALLGRYIAMQGGSVHLKSVG